jgi:hypothetical protein
MKREVKEVARLKTGSPSTVSRPLFICLRAGVRSPALKVCCCCFFFRESLLGFPEFFTNFQDCKAKEKLFELRVMETYGEGGV